MGRIAGICAALVLGVLIAAGEERFWLPVLLAAMVSTPFLGRWYCARLCPSNTMAALVPARRKGPGHSRRGEHGPVPTALRAAWFVGLGLGFALCLVLGIRPGLFTALTVASVLAGILLPRGLWCGSLCPWMATARLLGRLLPPGFPRRRPPCHGCRTCASSCVSRPSQPRS